MFAWKPLWWAMLFSWAKSLICDRFGNQIVTSAGVTSSLSSADALKECKLGVEMFFDQFFYSGGTENRPYNMEWSWKDG